ncbi:feruloyl-CoA synthase [Pusillimonas sp. DMV24BSW_D]|uniref:feruloyl-CoA synthase n=1 Tax=Neopusillimonas aestuarii TaxID=2716226 RepID=UPI001409C50B|nr:feruloyl-CoA synthase [Pusillimonas sp. DMV24BSW_D]QIM49501.1 feruloyl-CoA synthase [Pusillimonas sp. DMV24BSW_D]
MNSQGTGSIFATPAVALTERDDGTILLDNPVALAPYARCVGEYLEYWAESAPDREFIAQRSPAGLWQGLTYAQTLDKVQRLGTWLLKNRVTPDRPVCVLTDNSVDHALLMLAAMHVGIPYASISPAYSLMSKDHEKLRNLVERLNPGVIYVGGVARFQAALKSIESLHQAQLVVADEDACEGLNALRISEMLMQSDLALVNKAYAAVTPETVAKILFTSGSTGYPKGVLNTQRMLCSSQQAKEQVWPFLKEEPPILLDWLPWNHTFGSNHNFNMVLKHGGTLYLDGGKPVPGLFETSIANLRDIAPTLYMNVPRAFDMLLATLKTDTALRKQFFSRLQLIFYAGAALPQHLWDGLIEMSRAELGYPVPMVTAWGSTETSPLATDCHFQADRSGVIGLPVPGVTLKLAPGGDKLEVRVKGPVVTPGYFKQPDVTQAAFDEEGYYKIGDAVRFADPQRPEAGLIFDGRVSEDFKLTTGTWVSVGNVRVKGLEYLAPVAQDIVVTGHDRDDIGFLVFPNFAACRQLAGLDEGAPVSEVIAHPKVVEVVQQGLARLKKAHPASSTHAERASLLDSPPSVDDGEITDKGYTNQRAVLQRREMNVEALYDSQSGPEVIRP